MPTTRLSPDQRQQLQRDVKELALQQLSTRVIALRLGLTIARAQTIRKDLGLPARQSVTVTSKIRSRVLRLVAAFQTVGTIAEQVGIPSHVVYRIKREAGLVGRSKHSVPAEVEQTVVRLARKVSRSAPLPGRSGWPGPSLAASSANTV